MKRFLSMSFGVESTTMGVLYGKGATAIWCDTGWEHKEMYKRVDFVEQRLKEIHDGDFTLVRIKPDVFAKGRRVKKLQTYISRYRYMPTKAKRFCTKYFKIIPIDNFLSLQGECELMIGFNADEEPGEDRTGNYMSCNNVKYTYPLFENNLNREDCEDILYKHGLHPEFPIYMQRGGCVGCIFKQVAEFKALYFFDKRTFLQNKKLEESIQDKRKKFFTLSMSGRSFSDIQIECDRELIQWGKLEIESMYKKIKPSQSCGAFCHR